MKRSRTIALVLLGSASTAVFDGCNRVHTFPVERISAQAYYPNDYYIPGAGYYHAPFRAFFPYPYNYRFAAGSYYYGGQLGSTPFESVINISSPTEGAALSAQMNRIDLVPRAGFGGIANGYGHSHGGYFIGG